MKALPEYGDVGKKSTLPTPAEKNNEENRGL